MSPQHDAPASASESAVDDPQAATGGAPTTVTTIELYQTETGWAATQPGVKIVGTAARASLAVADYARQVAEQEEP